MFPTGVGMNRTGGQAVEVSGNVPHRRGDEPTYPLMILGPLACSPQAWG